MVGAQPRGLNRRKVEHLLRRAASSSSISERMDGLSRQFLGAPYRSNPLIGSAGEAEVFVAAIDGFDCVTYVESVLALARASTVADFAETLREIRYDKGLVQWRRRNHYMTSWMRNNARQGIIAPVSIAGVPAVSRNRVLNVLPGLAPRPIRIRCVPKSSAASLVARMKTGDLIFFVSTRRNLDVFHLGVVIAEGRTMLLRHASRSQGRVVEQELEEFLKMNRMAGIVAMRPREVARHAAVRNRYSVESSPVRAHRKSRRQATK